MRKYHVWAVIGLLLIAAGMLSAAGRPSPEASLVTESAAPNLVPNPSFETADGPLPAQWTTGAPRPEIAPSFSSDTVFARSGSRALCMSGAGRAGVVGWATAACPGILPGHAYELVAYVRAEDVKSIHESAWVKLSWFRDTSDDFPKVTYLRAVAPEGRWWRFTATLRAPEDAVVAEITLGLRHAPEGRLWWDDLSLRGVPAPPSRRVRIATAYLPADKRLDHEAWRAMIEQAGEGHADVVCLGEMVRVVPEPEEARPTIPGPATEALGELARRYRMMIIVSIPEWEGSLFHNTAVIIGKDGRLIGRYRKTHLPQNEVEQGSTPGATLPVFDTEIGRIGVQICYDHFFPEVARTLALKGAEIIFTPIWGDGRTDGAAYDAVARALDNSVYYVTSTFGERSLIIDPRGTILADSAGTPGVAFADIDLDAPIYERWLSVTGEAEFRSLWPKERRPELYGTVVEER
jgi:predicted amidohydrolase